MPAPTVPQNLDETHTHDTIDFTWDHPTSGTPDTYMIRIDGGGIMDEGPTPSYSLTDLSPDQEVLFEIYAHIYGVDGGDSAWVTMTVTTDPDPRSAPPVFLEETHTDTTIDLNWGTDVGSPIPDSFEVRIDGGAPVAHEFYSYEWTGLTAETEYLVEVRGVHDGWGVSAWAGLTVTTSDAPIPAIVWGDPDERYYHTGTDRGVLYMSDVSVPWNGITGVTEAGQGPATVLYRDGVIYHADVEPSDYSGSLTAFFWPDAFSKCLGIPEIAPGFHIDNQRPTPFGLSYRSLIGSGTLGDMFGYQIHLVYNAVASIGSRSRKTLNNSPEIMEFSFDLAAKPVKIPGFRPSSHFIIDTRNISPDALETLETILYGDGVLAARLPTPADLFDILSFGSAITFVDHGDGTWTATGSSQNLIEHDDGTIEILNVNGTDNGDGTYILEDTP